MSNYIPHHTKKKGILIKRERSLRLAIEGGFSPERIVRAAREVREAQFRVVNAIRSEIVTDLPKNDELLKECAEQETRWRTLSDEKIIEMYSR